MLRLFRPHHDALTETPGPDWRPASDTVWIDLLDPTEAEEDAVELALGIDIPTREDMAHIEPSSRLYQENGATFMTATLLAQANNGLPCSPRGVRQRTPLRFAPPCRNVLLRHPEFISGS